MRGSRRNGGAERGSRHAALEGHQPVVHEDPTPVTSDAGVSAAAVAVAAEASAAATAVAASRQPPAAPGMIQRRVGRVLHPGDGHLLALGQFFPMWPHCWHFQHTFL